MLIPTIVADDFFREPDELVKLSKTLEFESASDGRWPGLRSKFLHEIDRVLFDKINKKILSIIFPGQTELQYRCASSFQLIKQNSKKVGCIMIPHTCLQLLFIYLNTRM